MGPFFTGVEGEAQPLQRLQKMEMLILIIPIVAKGEDYRADRGRNPRIFEQKDAFIFSVIRRLWAEAFIWAKVFKCMKYQYFILQNACGFRV